MKLEIVSYELAKLLKEKGFKVECYRYYQYESPCNAYNLVDELDGMCTPICKDWNKDEIVDFDDEISVILYSAPTLDLVCKWLREVHNIFISIEPDYYPTVYNMYDEDNNGFMASEEIGNIYPDRYKTYEEALESGLKQALLLIKDK